MVWVVWVEMLVRQVVCLIVLQAVAPCLFRSDWGEVASYFLYGRSSPFRRSVCDDSSFLADQHDYLGRGLSVSHLDAL